MWAMEYNPNLFSSYETSSAGATPPNASDKELKAFGKFERNIVKTGYTEQHGALSVFLVASVLETKNKELLKKAKGLDDVVNVSLSLSICIATDLSMCMLFICLRLSHSSTSSPDLRRCNWESGC